MHRDEVVQTYDEAYAEAYDQRFLLDAWPRQAAELELEIVSGALGEGGRWLDVGCGTGWFLGRRPGVARAGIDLSPAMVARARSANPDALFIEERSFLDPEPRWEGGWDLVTCMWQPYNYVDSVADVERLIANLTAWTAPGGAVFVPVIDLEDIRAHVVLPYVEEPDVWGGTIALTSITWTWHEPLTGKVHTHLVAPHVEHFVALLAPAFRTIEIVRYPPTEPGGVARKAVLATGRRGPDDDGEATTIVRHPSPRHPDDVAREEAEIAHAAEAEARARDEAARAEAVSAEHAEAEARREADRIDLERRLAIAEHEAGWLRSTYGHLPPPAPDGSVHLGGTPTRRLVAEVARRLDPRARLGRRR